MSGDAAAGGYGHKGPALFDEQAANYVKYRPVYPRQLYNTILEWGGVALASPSARGLALDVATGSGQGQLSHAMQRPNIRYVLAPAEQLPAADTSVNLITCAQALHWFHIEEFYNDARRVLKPDGVLAVWSYGLPQFACPAARQYSEEALALANSQLLELYGGTLGAYWDERRGLVEKGYRGLEPGPSFFTTVERRELTMQDEMSINAVVGYLSSWSAHAEYRRAHPGLEDPLVAFKQQLMETLHVADAAESGAVLMKSTVPLILSKDPIILS